MPLSSDIKSYSREALSSGEVLALAAALLLVVQGPLVNELQSIFSPETPDAAEVGWHLTSLLVNLGIVVLAFLGARKSSGVWRVVGLASALVASVLAVAALLGLIAVPF
jgi:hypothetical protein